MTRHCRGHNLAGWWLPSVIGLPLLLLLQGADLDRAISSLFFDPASGRFPWKDQWWLKVVLHDGIKDASVLFALALGSAVLAGAFWEGLRKRRGSLLTLLVSMLLSAGLVAYIKSQSVPACPHELLMYGGSLPRLGIFDALQGHDVAGHCWPGGNASSAFCLFGLWFYFHAAGRPRRARAALVVILFLGVVLSVVQVMRGMHFLSHEVWTALICWYVSLIVFGISRALGVACQRPGHMFPHQC